MSAKTLTSLTLAAMVLAGCATPQSGVNNAYARLGVCQRDVVNRPEYAAVRAHIYSGEIPVSALTDDQRPTPQEARLLAAHWDAAASCRQAFLAELASAPANRPDGAQIWSAAGAQNASLIARLATGDMTWGQYAQAVQALRTATKAQLATADAEVSQNAAEQRQRLLTLGTIWSASQQHQPMPWNYPAAAPQPQYVNPVYQPYMPRPLQPYQPIPTSPSLTQQAQRFVPSPPPGPMVVIPYNDYGGTTLR
jgi:hypothetical protein